MWTSIRAQRRLDIHGHYTLVNKHDTPISELHRATADLPTRDASMTLAFPAHTVNARTRSWATIIYS